MTMCLHIMFCPMTPHKCAASLCRNPCCMRVGHVSSHNVIFVQHWTRVDIQEGESCPVGRNDHAAVCLGYGGDLPQLLITGGIDEGYKVLSDSWILDLQSGRWKEVRVRVELFGNHGDNLRGVLVSSELCSMCRSQYQVSN